MRNIKLVERLYQECAARLPIIDWHNHLSINDLYEDRSFSNITELWIAPDPYKHRAMRICGIPEERITGEVAPYEKFLAWAEVFPQLIGNPLYAWTKLELKRVFGTETELNPETAPGLWKALNRLLESRNFSSRNLLKRFGVEYAAPCAALEDDLSRFQGMEGIVPSLRGDGIVSLNPNMMEKLPEYLGRPIMNYQDFQEALSIRLKAFHSAGCGFSDHALDYAFRYFPDDGNNSKRFSDIINGKKLDEKERKILESNILHFLSMEYGKLGWTMQLHIGAMRNTSSRLRREVGPAGGFAGISSCCDTGSIAALLNDAEKENNLPGTILYTLNPADHAALAVLSGSFPGNGVRGKVTLGPAWWFCDHRAGMLDCLEASAAYGILSVFPGMTTDSRSLLSFVRHEYFRRVFCEWLSEKVALEEFTSDFSHLETLVKSVCFENAKKLIKRRNA